MVCESINHTSSGYCLWKKNGFRINDRLFRCNWFSQFSSFSCKESWLFINEDYSIISGVISNTRALNYTESHSYVLSVVAQDCGLNKSKPLLVTVEVKQACSTGWSGMNFFI